MRDPSRVHRLISFLLLVCFAFYGIEAEVADVHDGDADAVELTHNLALDTEGHPSPAPDGTDPGKDTHTFHVCHCSHTHIGVVPPVPYLSSGIAHESQQRRLQDTSVSIFRLAPPLRPPIA